MVGRACDCDRRRCPTRKRTETCSSSTNTVCPRRARFWSRLPVPAHARTLHTRARRRTCAFTKERTYAHYTRAGAGARAHSQKNARTHITHARAQAHVRIHKRTHARTHTRIGKTACTLPGPPTPRCTYRYRCAYACGPCAGPRIAHPLAGGSRTCKGTRAHMRIKARKRARTSDAGA